MAWILFSGFAVTATCLSTWRLARGDERWRGVALYAVGLCTVVAGGCVWLAFALLEHTCDESCFGPGWTHAADAWQWHALPILSSAGFAGIAAATILIALRRYRAGLALLGAAVVAFVPFVWLLVELA